MPEEARAQKKEIEGEPESEYDSEYDEEDDEEEDKSSEEEEEPVEEEEQKPVDDYDYGDPGSDYEWASDVDSQGRTIWGEEGVDFEWYYKEDKEAYERGESMVPDILLNKNQVDRNYDETSNYADRFTMLQGVKAKLAASGEPSLRYKKKVKVGFNKAYNPIKPGTGGGAMP